MALLTPLWMQNGAYPATVDRRLVGVLWPRGGVDGLAPSVVVNTMTIQFGAGIAVVPDSRVVGAAYLCASDSVAIVPLGQAPPANSDRIDLVVARPRDSAYAGADNDWILDPVAGVPAANPSVPAVPAGTIVVAQQRVIGGQPSLQAANLVDRRLPLAPGPIGNIATADGPPTQQDYGAAGGFPVSLTFTGRAGRRYRVHGYALGQQQTVQTTLAQLTLRVSGVTRFIGYTNFVPWAANTWISGAAWIDVIPGATTVYTADINVTAAQGAMRIRAMEANISVDDIGPA